MNSSRERDLTGADLAGADLTGADLGRADLRGANLTGANLARANLTGTNLTGADLGRANLTWADLGRADLTGADLGRASLTWADLARANLARANLTGTNLARADLTWADLTGTCLDPKALIPAPDLSPFEVRKVKGRLRAYGYRTKHSQVCGGKEYKPNRWYKAPWFSVSSTSCHPGIYMASLGWLSNKYPRRALVRCWAYADETHQAGDKYRCRRIYVLGDVDGG